ncbi:MAG TPA: diiron oxygenase, partial [Longimicrobiales bacterium]|nr:diiron oxygenase [Longimicrobiales bacterium]
MTGVAVLESLDSILRAADDPAKRSREVPVERIDFSKAFVPEENTQLFHTPVYETLDRAQRLRYNQLSGVRVNEFIMTLERDVLERVLIPLRRHRSVAGNPELLRGLESIIEDERLHYAGFARLNRMCLPDVFVGDRERYFTEPTRPQRLQFELFGLVARRLSFPLYSLIAMEESSMTMARRMVHLPANHRLGPLEPSFVAVHQEHMKDEARHVQIQTHLIDACLTSAGRLSRWSNSRLFKSTLRGLTTVGPSGSGAKVIRHFVGEFPELRPRT